MDWLIIICLLLGGSLAIWPVLTNAETVFVKHRGQVNLSPFECNWIQRSSFIERLCYDSREEYVIVKLNGTYYHYCEVPSRIVEAWYRADSMGRYYNQYIKKRYDCRNK